MLDGHLAGGSLVGHHAEIVHGGTDEGDTRLFHSLGKLRVLGEETVTGVNGLHAMFLRDGHNRGDIQIGGDGTLGSIQNETLVGFGAMQIVAIFVGVDGNRLRAQLLSSTDDANGNFAAIRRHHFGKGSLRHPSL